MSSVDNDVMRPTHDGTAPVRKFDVKYTRYRHTHV